MEESTNLIEPLLEKASAYGKTSIELMKLKALDKLSEIIPALVSRMAVVIVVCLFVLILSMGISFWLGDLLGKSYYGFFVVAGFYGIAGIVFYFFLHNWIKEPVGDAVITQILQQSS